VGSPSDGVLQRKLDLNHCFRSDYEVKKINIICVGLTEWCCYAERIELESLFRIRLWGKKQNKQHRILFYLLKKSGQWILLLDCTKKNATNSFDINWRLAMFCVWLCCTGVCASIVFDTVRTQRYGKFKKHQIQVRLYIINYYIKI
jgi:hypothetical protein